MLFYDKLLKTTVDINPQTAVSPRFERILSLDGIEQLQLQRSLTINGKRTHLLNGQRVIKSGCVFKPFNHSMLMGV